MTKGSPSKKFKATIGSQPMDCAVAYQIGRQCPIGQEPIVLAGLLKMWPDLGRSDARRDFERGLAERFAKAGV